VNHRQVNAIAEKREKLVSRESLNKAQCSKTQTNEPRHLYSVLNHIHQLPQQSVEGDTPALHRLNTIKLQPSSTVGITSNIIHAGVGVNRTLEEPDTWNIDGQPYFGFPTITTSDSEDQESSSSIQTIEVHTVNCLGRRDKKNIQDDKRIKD
jgi:hypothetical protein